MDRFGTHFAHKSAWFDRRMGFFNKQPPFRDGRIARVARDDPRHSPHDGKRLPYCALGPNTSPYSAISPGTLAKSSSTP